MNEQDKVKILEWLNLKHNWRKCQRLGASNCIECTRCPAHTYDYKGSTSKKEYPDQLCKPHLGLEGLFKYAVPKIGVGLDYIQFKSRKEGWLCVVRGVGLEKRAYYYNDPAEAFGEALIKLIDK